MNRTDDLKQAADSHNTDLHPQDAAATSNAVENTASTESAKATEATAATAAPAAASAAAPAAAAKEASKEHTGKKTVVGAAGEEGVEHAGFDPEEWRKLLGIKHWPSWFAIGLLAICAYIPNRIRDLIAIVLAWPLSFIKIRFKKVVFANLHTAFPEKSDAECQTIYRKLLTHAIITAFSYGEGVFLPRFMLERSWIVKNPEVLQAALDDKRPIIFCVPHTFSLDRGGLYLTANRHPMFGVSNDQSNPVFNWFMNYQRVIFGGTMHTRAAGFRSILKALKQGRHCYFLCDEDLGDDVPNVFVDFFGVPKAMVDTLPKMARLTKSQVVILTITYSLKKARYELEFTRLENFPSKDVVADLNRVTKVFEKNITPNVEQYMWFLRLFKTRPDMRYFTDCYADCHGTKGADKIKVDYEHRRTPLMEPMKLWDGYKPHLDYTDIVAAMKSDTAATATASASAADASASANQKA